MDERIELTRDLIHLTYTRLVEHMARQAYDTDRTDHFLTIVNRVCADGDIEILDQDLVDHLADGFPDPYDQFLLRVHVNTAALFHVGGWPELLGALRPVFDPRSLAPPARRDLPVASRPIPAGGEPRRVRVVVPRPRRAPAGGVADADRER